MNETKISTPLFPYRFCYKKRRDTITEATITLDGIITYTGLDDSSILESIRGISFNSPSSLLEAINPNAKKSFKSFYYLDEEGNITETTFKDIQTQFNPTKKEKEKQNTSKTSGTDVSINLKKR
jgi:hypothetical protein